MAPKKKPAPRKKPAARKAAAPKLLAKEPAGGFLVTDQGARCTAKGCGVLVTAPQADELEHTLEAHQALHT